MEKYNSLRRCRTVGNAFSRVPVDSLLCLFVNMIVDITIPSRPFVFSQSEVQIFAGLTNLSGLAVAAFDLINCSLSVARFVFVLKVCQ